MLLMSTEGTWLYQRDGFSNPTCVVVTDGVFDDVALHSSGQSEYIFQVIRLQTTHKAIQEVLSDLLTHLFWRLDCTNASEWSLHCHSVFSNYSWYRGRKEHGCNKKSASKIALSWIAMFAQVSSHHRKILTTRHLERSNSGPAYLAYPTMILRQTSSNCSKNTWNQLKWM